jgi:hypothetical protein
MECPERVKETVRAKRAKKELPCSVVNSPSVRYLDPQYRTGYLYTRTSPVLYALIRYLDPKVEEMRS